MPRYPKEVKSFIAEHVQGTTTKDLVELVNAKFDLGFTESKMRAYKTNHKLRSGTPCGLPAGHASKEYPQKVQRFILDNYHGTGHQAMADLLNAKFGTNYTKEHIKGYYANHKLNSGLKGYFKKGHVPANKGVKGISYEGMKATQFKPGHVPHNYKPVGTERVNGDGYVDIKIADPNKWKSKHIILWEAENGPLPPGHVVIFADGNNRNFDLNNLLLVTRRQLVRLNQNHMIQADAELTKTGVIIANIQNMIGERKRQKHSKGVVR